MNKKEKYMLLSDFHILNELRDIIQSLNQRYAIYLEYEDYYKNFILKKKLTEDQLLFYDQLKIYYKDYYEYDVSIFCKFATLLKNKDLSNYLIQNISRLIQKQETLYRTFRLIDVLRGREDIEKDFKPNRENITNLLCQYPTVLDDDTIIVDDFEKFKEMNDIRVIKE